MFGKTENGKVEFLREKNNELVEENLRMIDSTISVAYRLDDKVVLGEAYIEKGNYFLEQRNYNSALKNFTISKQLSTEIKDDFTFYSSLVGIAKAKENLYEIKESIELYEASLLYFEKHKQQSKSFSIYLSILGKLSYLYSKTNRLNKSNYYNKIELSETVDTANYHYALKNKGIIDFYKKDYYSSFNTLKKAQRVFWKQNDIKWYVISEQFLGEILYQQKRNKEAIAYFKNVVEFSKQYKILDEELRLSYERVVEYNEKFGNNRDKLLAVNNLLSFDSLFYLADHTVLKPNLEKYENTFLKTERNLLKEKNQSFKRISFFCLVAILIFSGIFFYKMNQNHQKKKEYLQKCLDEISIIETEITQGNQLEKTKYEVIIDEDFEQSLQLFEEQKLFLNPKISLNDLVKELNANRTIVSNYINRSRSKNFNQYINELRINHLLNRLVDEPYLKKYTIDALAEETGFNSRKTFSDAFLDHTGFRPSNFIKNLSK
ncbi:helix-turn-helix domain-containing protein [Empedobacter brevis]|uniref:helix-turn-helix domain-containing protein n=1 Tax=Empedobacter brevis TaxID=247 RepID=UPI0039B03E0E